MTLNSAPAPLSDDPRRAQLRRTKFFATSVLVGCLVLLAGARSLESRHPAFGFVAAFAEAAAIGGLADWYAVVALFRRPLGLPIPHTAIIPSNQKRIAEKLGEFVESNFLAEAAVEDRLRRTDFADLVSRWLADRQRSQDLARFLLRLLPEALAAAETSGLKTFLARRAQAQLRSINFTPLAARAVRAFLSDGAHQKLLDDLMRAVHEALNKPETMAAIREKIRDELPTLLKFYRADAYLLNKVAASAAAFFEDVRNNPEHPLRAEANRFALSFAERLETDPAWAAELAVIERDLLSRPEFSALAEQLWLSVRTYLEKSAAGESRALENRFAQLLRDAGAQLAADPDMRAEINRACVATAGRIVTDHRGEVGAFIAEQVQSWDMTQLVTLIELNIGQDLQYIRFNGALIGGLAGLALHAGELLLRAA